MLLPLPFLLIAGALALPAFAQGTQELTVSKNGAGTGTLTSSPSGIDCGATCAAHFTLGSNVTLTAAPGPGSAFAGWFGSGCTGTGTCTLTMDAPKGVSATFNTVPSHTLTVEKAGPGQFSSVVTSSPAGIDCGSTCSVNFAIGTVVTLTATPGPGATFGQWTGGGCSGNGSCTVTMDGARTVFASFNQPITWGVSITRTGTGSGRVVGDGVDCGADCAGGPYPEGSSREFTAIPDHGSVFGSWVNILPCSTNPVCRVSGLGMSYGFSVRFDATIPALQVAPQDIDFGGQSMQTSATRTVTLTNATGATVTVSSVTGEGYFQPLSHACGTLTAGQSCSAVVSFTPGDEATLSARLTFKTSAGSQVVYMTGTGERSLVTHFYQSILSREPDSGGKVYWQDEAARLSGLGANINETWFAMASNFYASQEYTSRNATTAQYVTDLYDTFFNRAPDGPGLSHWTGQLASGLPREIALLSFMFSPEFAAFTQGIFGDTAARPEIDMVMDFYRGAFNRLPDTPGFKHWVNRMRAAQCSGSAAVTQEADAISGAFFASAEYAARNRGNPLFVSDLYNAFLRRGGDLNGVNFWINRLDTGQGDRNGLRLAFLQSPEFANRVNAVVAAGCQPAIP